MEILSLPVDRVEFELPQSPNASVDSTLPPTRPLPDEEMTIVSATVAPSSPPPAKHLKNITTSVSGGGLPHLPATYVALYPYKPQKFDELELKKGCKLNIISGPLFHSVIIINNNLSDDINLNKSNRNGPTNRHS